MAGVFFGHAPIVGQGDVSGHSGFSDYLVDFFGSRYFALERQLDGPFANGQVGDTE
jgi:hypothetical protein